MLIYRLRDIKKGYLYYGKTTRNLDVRFAEHLKNLSKGQHHNTFLQNIYNLDPNRLVCELVEDNISTLEELDKKEIYYISNFGTINIHKGGKGGDNVSKHPDREKLRQENSQRQSEYWDDLKTETYGNITQVDLNGNIVRNFTHFRELREESFVSFRVEKCLLGKAKTYKKFLFFQTEKLPKNLAEYVKEYLINASKGVTRGSLEDRIGSVQKQTFIQRLKDNAKARRTKVAKCNKQGHVLAVYESQLQAAKAENISQGTLNNWIRGGGINQQGIIWRKI